MMIKFLLFLFLLYNLYDYYLCPGIITEKYLFTDKLSNITDILLYSNNAVYIYQNDMTLPNFYFDTYDKHKFIDKLDLLGYQEKLTYINGNPFNIFDYLYLIIFLMLYVTYNRTVSKYTEINQIHNINYKVSTKLDDVAGLESNKRDILEVIDFFKNKDKYLQIGSKMPKGILFYGPSGTGKTLLAKAIAGECGISFIYMSGSEFNQLYIGVGSSRVRNLFENAKKNSPCIIFIDEIDALGRKRSSNGVSNDSEKENTLNQFLVELDGFKENTNIITIGATNRIDMLDEALLRPGRFDRKVRFDLPEIKDREKIFNLYLKKMKIRGNLREMKIYFSKMTIGLTSADISNICNEAGILAVRNKEEYIDRKNIEEAIDIIMLGKEKKDFILKEKEREIVAYHEAGHTIISYILENASNPIRVSIIPRGKAALGFSQSEIPDNKLMTQNQILDQICVLLGGRVAEEIFFPDSITTGASDDIEKLTNFAYNYVTTFGMDENLPNFYLNKNYNNYSEKIKELVDISVQEIINKSYLKVKNIITTHKKIIEVLARELLEKETLEGRELQDLIKSNM